MLNKLRCVKEGGDSGASNLGANFDGRSVEDRNMGDRKGSFSCGVT